MAQPPATLPTTASDEAELPQARPTWGETLRVYLEPASLRMFALGLLGRVCPLLLVLGTLSFRLREAGLDRTTIGYLSWVGSGLWLQVVLGTAGGPPAHSAAHTLAGSPAQLAAAFPGLLIMASLVGMALADPRTELHAGRVVCAGRGIRICYARHCARRVSHRVGRYASHQGALAATYQTGYRLAMIWAGAGVLWIAARAELACRSASSGRGGAGRAVPAGRLDHGLSWSWPPACWWVCSPCCFPASRRAWRCRPPATRPTGCSSALVEPFADFLKRYGKQALLILALIGVYRISDVVMGIMANPFYVDMGYTKDEVAAVTKVFGVIMTLVGAFVGGGTLAQAGRDACAHARRRSLGRKQPAVRVLAGRPRARRDGVDAS